MTLSAQTQVDLASILETLDQRLHELTEERGQPHYVAHSGEADALSALRNSAAGMLSAD